MGPTYSAVLLRYGEIAIKSDQTRRRMTKMLVKHIKSALKEKSAKYSDIIVQYGRIFVETEEPQHVAEVASKVFGIVSTSPVVVVSSNLDDIVETGFAIASSEFDKSLPFAVGARRIGTHDYTSQDVREKLGERIYEDLGISVDLSNPGQTIYVEVREDKAYIFTKTIRGVGGMPSGTQGKV
ncbi:MAG: THUMP domain-containing protein, partial [Candidatus Thorarchaeota archaeon]